MPKSYSRRIALVDFGLTLGLCYLLGARGETLVIAAAVAYFPMLFVWAFLTRRVLPPVLEVEDPLSARHLP